MSRWAVFLTVAPILLCCVAAVYISAIGASVTGAQRWVVIGLVAPALLLSALRLAQLTRELSSVLETREVLERFESRREGGSKDGE